MTTSVPATENTTLSNRRISLEAVLYLLVGITAVCLRTIALGTAPLYPNEAQHTLAAWLSLNEIPGLLLPVSNPLLNLTSTLNLMLGMHNNAAMRFPSVLAGVLIVFSPLLFRNTLGRIPTVISVGLLAISPAVVLPTRHLTGGPISVISVVLLVSLLERYSADPRQSTLVTGGIVLGIGLLADPGTLLMLISLFIAAGLTILTNHPEDSSDAVSTELITRSNLLVFGTAALITTALLSTIFFTLPQGLAALGTLLQQAFTGVVMRSPGVPYLGMVMLTLMPGLVLLGIIGAWLGFYAHDTKERFLAGWGISILLLSLIYPGAQPYHVLWSVVPLAMLSARLLSRTEQLVHHAPRWAVGSHLSLNIALLAMAFASLSQFLKRPTFFTIPEGAPPETATVAIALELVFLGLWITLLITTWIGASSLWGLNSGYKNLGLTGVVLICLGSLGLSTSFAFSHPETPYNLLNQQAPQPTLSILVETAHTISDIAEGHPDEAAITIVAVENPSLVWSMKEFHNLRLVEQLPANTEAPMVITPADVDEPQTAAAYVGQEFVITRNWLPAGLSTGEFLHWLIYHTSDTPADEERVILWVRDDIYQLTRAR